MVQKQMHHTMKNYVMMYVVDDETLFFYAGLFDETRQDRKGYGLKQNSTIMEQ